MGPTLIVLGILGLIIGYIWGHPILLYIKHYRIKQRTFPLDWEGILVERLPLYSQLSFSLKKRLQSSIQVFLAEKQFIGCNGLKITDEMRLAIAAQACLLAINLPENYYPKLVMILVYPDIFKIQRVAAIADYIVEDQDVIASGESWGKEGQVIFSWQTIQEDLERGQDGHNVIFHEFAHQLDQAEGIANGVPHLKTQNDYGQWASIFTAEYQQLLSQIEQGLPTVIDPYGATNPVEFFAVVTETFFEKASLLQREHPSLYQLLKNYYQLDPLHWSEI
ncbi:MAG: zinc-dependent peptidase [Microcystaceae cyanobacterium]